MMRAECPQFGRQGTRHSRTVVEGVSVPRYPRVLMHRHQNPALVPSTQPSQGFVPCRPSPSSEQRMACRAAAQESSGAKDLTVSSGFLEMATLGVLFASWYMANIVFNIYNKQVLKVFPFPLTCTTVQFLVGSVLALACWGTGLVKAPQVSTNTITKIVPLAIVHTLGNLLTNMSLGAVAVSFTHTIKAMEPIFSVGLSALFLNDYPHPLVLLTLLPIMGGVVLASVSEATFNWFGFGSAMASNLTFQSRNVLSKKMMLKDPDAGGGGTSASGSVTTEAAKSQGLDNINLFAIITCMSFLIVLPINLAVEGWSLTPAALTAMGVTDTTKVLTQAAITGLCFHAYQQVSYMILSRVTPVTHSIGNCVKRVVVIVASVLFFRNPMSFQCAAGTGIALLGVFAYSQAKRMTGKPKLKTA